jgi:hypothetical protein
MPPTVPFWFKQRQCKAEPLGGDNQLKLTGPNLSDAYISVSRADNGRWRAALRLATDGPEVGATDAELPDETAAWEAAFELYRTHLIV